VIETFPDKERGLVRMTGWMKNRGGGGGVLTATIFGGEKVFCGRYGVDFFARERPTFRVVVNSRSAIGAFLWDEVGGKD